MVDAFVLHVGNSVFVEFSKTGNACYQYTKNDWTKIMERNRLVLGERKMLSLNVTQIKDKKLAKERFLHDIKGKWKEDLRTAVIRAHNS